MIKKITILAIGLFITKPVFAQNGNFDFHDGSKINMSTIMWTNPLISNIKFLKAKEEKKDEMIADFNEEVNSGKLLPSKSSYTYRVKEDTVTPFRKNYTVTANFGGKDYSSYLMVFMDTLYLYRTKGLVLLGTPGSELGFMIQGVQKVPMYLKVGDKLPEYEDISVMYPTTTTKTVKESIYAGMSSHTTQEVGPYIDSKTGNAGNGIYEKTTTSAVYNSIDVKVKETLSLSAKTTYYVNASVTRTDNITVNGKAYTAYVIESETWTKSKTEASYEAEHHATEQAQKKVFDKMQQKVSKKMKNWGLNNEDGYMITYKEEWFVPELGSMAKMRSYDMYGAVSADVMIDSIN